MEGESGNLSNTARSKNLLKNSCRELAEEFFEHQRGPFLNVRRHYRFVVA